MTVQVVKLVFSDVDVEDIWSALRSAGANGFLAASHAECLALILDNARVLDALHRKKVLKGHFSQIPLPNVATGPFKGLRRVQRKPQKPPATELFCDKVTPNGLLRGWGRDAAGRTCNLRLSIDGRPVGLFPVNRFRLDLLRSGFGTGCHGFSTRLPDWALDGESHEIVGELLSEGQTEEQVVATTSRTMKLPYHFNLPRPWVGTGVEHATEWPARVEAEYLDIRAQVIDGTLKDGLNRAAGFIDAHPQAVFLDFGLKDRCRIDDRRFEQFQDRVCDRWGYLFGKTPCELGDRCCKRLDLSYNADAPPITPPGMTNPLREARPWRKGGLLDDCPRKIRHFASKELTRAYARARSIAVPETYATLRSMADFDAFQFPKRYVLKPDFGSGVALFLMHGNLNLFDGFTYSREDIRGKVAQYMEDHAHCEFVVEEYIVQEGASVDLPFLPLDYKVHCFGGKARIIHVDDKNAISRDPLHRRQSWLARDWSHCRAPFRQVVEHPNVPIVAPRCLPEILRLADQIATDLKDYVRVDFYASDTGAVLGEVTSFTHAGLGFTEYGDLILGQAWEIFSRTRERAI